MIGHRFGRLLVLANAGPSVSGTNRANRVLCRCDCGCTSEVYPAALRSGATVSCGCHKAERMRETSLRRTAEVHRRQEQAAIAALPGTTHDLAKRIGTRTTRLRPTLTRLSLRGVVVLEGDTWRAA